MELKVSQTEKNLQTAFAGESQARNKYSYYASKAKKDGYNQIAAIFEETAANEKEHAKIWFKLTSGRTCMPDSPKPPRKRVSTISPRCLQWSVRLKNTMRSVTKNCWPTLRVALFSPATTTWFGSAPTAVTSSSAKKRPKYARFATIRSRISRSKRRIFNYNYN